MKVQVPDNIFRAYDIRGIVGQGLDEPLVHLIGRAVGSEALERGESAIALAADARLSSPAFTAAMIAGVLATGCNVVNLGTVPTPVMYFATHHLQTGSGVMITGSHNPGNYNGVKIVLGRHCLAADQIDRLKERIQRGDFLTGTGTSAPLDIRPAYYKRICSDILLSRPMKVVIDCGNGVAGNTAPMLFAALGCQVIPLYCEPDGNFPNHHPDPTESDNLADLVDRVQREGADLGIALDGDGDRVGLVSGSGAVIDADSMMLSFIDDILPGNPGAKIIFDVKSSQQLPKLVGRLGGRPVMCKSGHSFVKKEMQATGALLGGEYSAHIFFRHRWYGFDDGLYTAARYLELMDRHRCTADALLLAHPPSFSTPELKVPVREEDKFGIMATLLEKLDFPGASISRLDGVRADTGRAWGLVRASNTTPNLILRFEADSLEALAAIQSAFREAITALIPSLLLPLPSARRA